MKLLIFYLITFFFFTCSDKVVNNDNDRLSHSDLILGSWRLDSIVFIGDTTNNTDSANALLKKESFWYYDFNTDSSFMQYTKDSMQLGLYVLPFYQSKREYVLIGDSIVFTEHEIIDRGTYSIHFNDNENLLLKSSELELYLRKISAIPDSVWKYWDMEDTNRIIGKWKNVITDSIIIYAENDTMYNGDSVLYGYYKIYPDSFSVIREYYLYENAFVPKYKWQFRFFGNDTLVFRDITVEQHDHKLIRVE